MLRLGTLLLTVGPAVAFLALVSGTSQGALISISSTASVDSPDYNLTTVYGPSDWRYWTANTTPAPGTPTNEKLGPSLIGDMSTFGGGNLRGSTSDNVPPHDFVFSDGISPVAGTASDVIGLLNTQLNTVGAGVQLDVVSPTADPYLIHLWGVAFATDVGTLTASVGAATATDTTLTANGNRVGRLYTIFVDPDSVGQIVNLRLALTDDGAGANSNVSIAAVAVNAVPEPTTFLIWSILGTMALAVRRRRPVAV